MRQGIFSSLSIAARILILLAAIFSPYLVLAQQRQAPKVEFKSPEPGTGFRITGTDANVDKIYLIVLNGRTDETCRAQGFLAAMQAAREFVPQAIADKPLYRSADQIARTPGWRVTEGDNEFTFTVPLETPGDYRRAADKLEQAELERQAKVKRQRAAVDEFNKVYSQCVAPALEFINQHQLTDKKK